MSTLMSILKCQHPTSLILWTLIKYHHDVWGS